MDITGGRLVVGEEDVCSKNSNSGTKERIADAILNKTIHGILEPKKGLLMPS
jgi:hypothetical protein